MKKVLISLMALVLSIPTFAQMGASGFSISENNLYYGIRIGAAFAGIGGDAVDLIDWGTKTGFTLGGVAGLRVSDASPVFLESGLYFTQRGAKKDDNKIGLSYLEIPLLIKYGIQATDQISVLPFFGPAVSFGIGGSKKVGLSPSESSYGDGKYNHFDFGLKAGVGAEYNMIYAELGYQFGIANIYNNAKGSPTEFSQNGHALFFNVGINF